MNVDLTVVWAGIILFAIAMYVVMDGFDLGIAILFTRFQVGAEQEQQRQCQGKTGAHAAQPGMRAHTEVQGGSADEYKNQAHQPIASRQAASGRVIAHIARNQQSNYEECVNGEEQPSDDDPYFEQ